MSFELAMLVASCVLCLIQIVVSSHAASFQRGYRWTASSRDAKVSPLTGVAGRLERALRNFLETFPVLWWRSSLFTCSVVRAPSANGELVSIFPPDWFTFYSTQRAFLCSGRSSGMPRSLELSFFCSLQSGPSYSARMPTAVTSRSSASMPS